MNIFFGLRIVGVHCFIVAKFFLDGLVHAHSIFGGVRGARTEELSVEMEEFSRLCGHDIRMDANASVWGESGESSPAAASMMAVG